MVWRFAGELFEVDAVLEALIGDGIAVDVRALRPEWDSRIAKTLQQASLETPKSAAWAVGGRVGITRASRPSFVGDAVPAARPIRTPHGESGVYGRFFAAERVLEILRGVPDPEIPCISVVDLGIVREVREDKVVITPTYTGCPASLAIESDIRTRAQPRRLSAMKIETVLSPPWTTDWINDSGREKLRDYGIAPPPKGAAAHSLRETQAECPRCGSSNTEEISRFGLDALQGASSLLGLPRALRPLQMSLTHVGQRAIPHTENRRAAARDGGRGLHPLRNSTRTEADLRL